MSDNTIKYSSAGNLISLTIDKYYNIMDINIDDTLLVKDQKELLEEMLESSINEAIKKIRETNERLEIDENYDSKKTNNGKDIPNPFNMNFSDMNKMFDNISKMTSVEFKDGKINISLDSISPEMISKMNDIINNKDNKDNN